ncbi:MAG: zinc-ribbon domain-containing protein [Blastocatellia bacterium]|nr:zinc-ribbon domain-containing protein [Blastocatellia bacterium]
MYCPKCGSQNNDDIKFCRSCGTNIGLVTQALTGQMTATSNPGPLPLDQKQISKGFRELFMGLGFAAIAIFSFAVRGMGWGIWMFIPAFAMMGKGMSLLAPLFLSGKIGIHIGQAQPQPLPQTRNTNELPPLPNYEALPPPSVTESTTRHLDAKPVERRPREREF